MANKKVLVLEFDKNVDEECGICLNFSRMEDICAKNQ